MKIVYVCVCVYECARVCERKSMYLYMDVFTTFSCVSAACVCMCVTERESMCVCIHEYTTFSCVSTEYAYTPFSCVSG